MCGQCVGQLPVDPAILATDPDEQEVAETLGAAIINSLEFTAWPPTV
jgi:hypothetical protein